MRTHDNANQPIRSAFGAGAMWLVLLLVSAPLVSAAETADGRVDTASVDAAGGIEAPPRREPEDIVDPEGNNFNPARFSGPTRGSAWQPRSAWDTDASRNDFNPSRWIRRSRESTWRPHSDWDSDPARNSFSPSRWSPRPRDPVWRAEDGFAKWKTSSSRTSLR